MNSASIDQCLRSQWNRVAPNWGYVRHSTISPHFPSHFAQQRAEQCVFCCMENARGDKKWYNIFEVSLANLVGKLEPFEGKKGTATFVEGKCNFARGGSLSRKFSWRDNIAAKTSVFTVNSQCERILAYNHGMDSGLVESGMKKFCLQQFIRVNWIFTKCEWFYN